MDAYIEMLIAAGWVKAEDMDEDYQCFLRTTPIDNEFTTYADYKSLVAENETLGKEYDSFIGYCALSGLSFEDRQRQRKILAELSHFDYLLGY